MTKNSASGNARVGMQVGNDNQVSENARVGVQTGEWEEAASTPHPGYQVCDGCRKEKTGR
jgi:uncharacterized protein with beta-barrel porin domain